MDAPIIEGDHLEGPFNRSAALNDAASRAGDWDVAILLDSDVLVDLNRVRQAVTLAEQTGRVVHPFREWRGLKPQMTEKVLSGYRGDWSRNGIHQTYRTNISACVVVPRAVWGATGGFDERFQGWGWEDSAWMWAVKALTGGHLRIKGELWHLWHKPSPEKEPGSPLLAQNKELAMRYWNAVCDPDEMLSVLSEDGGPLS